MAVPLVSSVAMGNFCKMRTIILTYEVILLTEGDKACELSEISMDSVGCSQPTLIFLVVALC